MKLILFLFLGVFGFCIFICAIAIVLLLTVLFVKILDKIKKYKSMEYSVSLYGAEEILVVRSSLDFEEIIHEKRRLDWLLKYNSFDGILEFRRKIYHECGYWVVLYCPNFIVDREYGPYETKEEAILDFEDYDLKFDKIIRYGRLQV